MDARPIPAKNGVLDAAIEALRGLGLGADVVGLNPRLGRTQADALLRIRHGAHDVLYVAGVTRDLRPATLGATLHQLERLGANALLVTNHVTPPLADELRARGVAFIDAAGNAFLDRAPLYVCVKGARRPQHVLAAERGGRAFQASGLQVIFAILCHPEWANRPYRDIAKRAGVAHGTVGWVMAELLEIGFAAHVGGRRRLIQGDRLLERWVEAYARTLRPRLQLARYRVADIEALVEMDPSKYGMVLGGEIGAARMTDALRPETVTLYAHKIEQQFVMDLKLRPDAKGNVEVFRRFWNFDGEDLQLAPPAIVYADLVINGDARCLEAATPIHERLIAGLV